MADVFTESKRSELMSRILGRGNKTTELAAVAMFRRHRISGWRRHQAIFGNPDFIFPKLHLAIFVDGCFWHCCPKHATQPASNRAFWKKNSPVIKPVTRL
jgi:DNA mismatch endonuclease (patch repair protein)